MLYPLESMRRPNQIFRLVLGLECDQRQFEDQEIGILQFFPNRPRLICMRVADIHISHVSELLSGFTHGKSDIRPAIKQKGTTLALKEEIRLEVVNVVVKRGPRSKEGDFQLIHKAHFPLGFPSHLVSPICEISDFSMCLTVRGLVP